MYSNGHICVYFSDEEGKPFVPKVCQYVLNITFIPFLHAQHIQI